MTFGDEPIGLLSRSGVFGTIWSIKVPPKAIAMKKLLATLAMLLAAAGAQSSTITSGSLQVVNASPATINGAFNPAPINLVGYTGAYAGKVNATSAGTLTATYLGQESGYLNGFSFESDKFPLTFAIKNKNQPLSGGNPDPNDYTDSLNEFDSLISKNHLGRTISTQVNAGLLEFWFRDSTGGWVSDTSGSDGKSDFAVFTYAANKCFTSYGCFDFILGFDDSGGGLDRDFDDFMVGIKLSPVPLPAAVWLFGSALIGFVMVSNRRKV